MFKNLYRRLKIRSRTVIFSALLGMMFLPAKLYGADSFPEVNPTPPPKSEWLTKVIGWTLWVALGIVTLYFIIATVSAVRAVRDGRGSTGDAVKQAAVAIIVLVILGSLTAFLNTVVGAF